MPLMDVSDLLTRLADEITGRRVFGKPYERDGVVVIPAAEVRGGGGSGDEGIPGSGGGGLGAEPQALTLPATRRVARSLLWRQCGALGWEG